MIAYASRTGTLRNLDAMRSAGWRLLVSAAGEHRTEGFRYAIDNGAWSAFCQGRQFDVPAFDRVVHRLGDAADFIVAPDIVEGGAASLDLSLSWVPQLRGVAPVLIAVQDGMTDDDLRPHVDERVGIFVGGSTRWKLSSLPRWGRLAREVGCYLHVGRVNSCRRIGFSALCGAHSFDGTSATRFASTLPRLDNARRQGVLRW